MELEIKLTVDEINALLGLLGELPIKTGIYPVAIKIKNQADEQLKSKELPPCR